MKSLLFTLLFVLSVNVMAQNDSATETTKTRVEYGVLSVLTGQTNTGSPQIMSSDLSTIVFEFGDKRSGKLINEDGTDFKPLSLAHLLSYFAKFGYEIINTNVTQVEYKMYGKLNCYTFILKSNVKVPKP